LKISEPHKNLVVPAFGPADTLHPQFERRHIGVGRDCCRTGSLSATCGRRAARWCRLSTIRVRMQRAGSAASSRASFDHLVGARPASRGVRTSVMTIAAALRCR
jgi:hypothetical protein